MAHLPCYIKALRIVHSISGPSEDSAYTWIPVELYIGQRLLDSLLSVC